MNGNHFREIAATLESGRRWLDDGTNDVLTSVLRVAHDAGAPRARILRVIADAVDDNDSVIREVRIAATSSRTSARILVWLPVATSVASALIGLDTLGFLFVTPTGWACLALGASSTAWGWWWMKRLVSEVRIPPLETGLIADLTAEILSVTAMSSETLTAIEECAQRWNAVDEWQMVVSLRENCRETGAPVAGVVRAAATDRRRRMRLDAREHIEALPAKLLAPLGVCLFPAFVVLTVIPAVATMATGFFTRSG